MKRIIGLAVICFLAAGCTEMQVASHLWKKASAPPEQGPEDGTGAGPRCHYSQKGHYKVGRPYKSGDMRYYPIKSSFNFAEQGIASWYGTAFHGRTTANGECYDMYKLTAAHPTLPLPTIARVTNLDNGKSVVVRINDRGPYKRGRVIDLSYAAAKALNIAKAGTGPVKVEAIDGPHHYPDGFNPNRRPQTRVVQRQPAPATSQAKQVASAEMPAASEPAASFTRRVTVTSENATEQKKPMDNVTLYIQTGAFGNKSNAQQQAAQVMAKAGKTAELQPFMRAGKTLHRVRVGPYTNVTAADDALARIVQAGFNTAVIAVVEK